MNSNNRLFVKPFSWSVVTPSSTTTMFVQSIQIFGYTSSQQTIYIRIPCKYTYILKFGQEVDESMVQDILETMSPAKLKYSNIDPKILILRDPEISPVTLLADLELQSNAIWIEAKKDPYGELQSFWESKEIGPYEWLAIDNYSPLSGQYTSCDINIKTEEQHVLGLGDIGTEIQAPKVLFWDIETFSSKKGEFPNSNNVSDYIALISIITSYQHNIHSYVIIKGNVDEAALNKRYNMPRIIRVTSEKELLDKFFSIYSSFQPDRQVYHNGDMFDMPYLLNRLNINGMKLPLISKITKLNPWVTTRAYPTHFGKEYDKTMVVPGTEIVDLIHYYRRFYPYIRNFKLDTIGKIFLGEGKTGLSIEDMMNALRIDNPEKLTEVVDYSYVDSLRMMELWDGDSISYRLEQICNNLGIDNDMLLRYSLDNIIDRVAYNIDPGCAVTKSKQETTSNVVDAIRGVYKNVYTYDYSELYRTIMLENGDEFTIKLASRLEGAPPKLILTAFYSSYINRNKLLPIFNAVLQELLSTKIIIALDSIIIRAINPVDAKWLKLVNKISCYVSVSKASYITFDDEGELEIVGIAKLCRPKFRLATELIKQYLILVYNNNLQSFLIPDLTTVKQDEFILTETLKSTIDLKPGTLKFNLLKQYGSSVDTWTSVKYIITRRGPILISNLQSSDEIDYNYYNLELTNYLKELRTLPIYGI